MFPLVRMLEYGNKVIQKEIKKVDSVYGTLYVLYSTGELYGIGRNVNYNIGNGTNTSVNEWYLMSDDVSDFFISHGSDLSCIVKKNDGSWWHCGVLSIFGISGYNTALTNVDQHLSVLNNGYDEIFMNASNIWYRKGQQYFRMGNNSNYNLLTGNTSSLTQFTEYVLPSDVKAIFPGILGTIVTYNDGTVKGIGNNGSSRVGLTARQQYTTLTTISIPEPKKVFFSMTSTWFYTDSGLYACGVCKYGQLGNGVIDSNNYINTPIQIKTTNPISLSNGDGSTIMYYQEPHIGVGSQLRFGIGQTANIATFVNLNSGLPINIIMNDYCSYYHTDTALFGTGQIPASKNNLLPGYTSNQTSFVQLEIPR